MQKKQKLELTWIGKENRPKLEPRILLEDLDKERKAIMKQWAKREEQIEGLELKLLESNTINYR